MIELGGVAAHAISPLSDTQALTLGLGHNHPETIRIATDGGEERVTYSGYLLRKINPAGA